MIFPRLSPSLLFIPIHCVILLSPPPLLSFQGDRLMCLPLISLTTHTPPAQHGSSRKPNLRQNGGNSYLYQHGLVLLLLLLLYTI